MEEACRDYDDHYSNYHPYGLGVVPFFSFTIFDDDDDHFRHRRFHHPRKFRRHRKHWDWD